MRGRQLSLGGDDLDQLVLDLGHFFEAFNSRLLFLLVAVAGVVGFEVGQEMERQPTQFEALQLQVDERGPGQVEESVL